MFEPHVPADPPSEPQPDAPPGGPEDRPADMVDQGPRFERWSRTTRIPLLVLGCAFLVLMLLPALDTGLTQDQKDAVWGAELAIWLAFTLDYAAKAGLARNRGAFFRSHLFDLLMVALPVFRPLGALRIVGVFALMARGLRRNRSLRTATYTGGIFVAVLLVGSYAEWLAERHAPGADILTYGESLWWALVTAATVGYGDYVPVTTMGRIVAAGMMITGIATLSVITASAASWLVQLSRREDDQVAAKAERELLIEQFRTLLHEVQQLNRRLDGLERRRDAGGPER